MSSRPSFQFYPNDWLSSDNIMLMSAAQEGAYIRLLAIAWGSDDCGLPDDLDKLAKLGRVDREAIGLVMENFVLRDGRWYNERLLDEREKQNKFRDDMTKAGRKGAKMRWQSQKPSDRVGHSQAIARGMASDSSSSSSSSSSSKEKEKAKKEISQKEIMEKLEKLTLNPDREKDPEYNAIVDDFATRKSLTVSEVRAELDKFISHWTEPTKGKRPLWETQKSWDTRRRIDKWMDNYISWYRGKEQKGGTRGGFIS